MIDIAIKRSAQSVLHQANFPREEATRIGEQIAQSLTQPGAYQIAATHYATTDEFEIGERVAREYLCALTSPA
jgi:hypothetical protein